MRIFLPSLLVFVTATAQGQIVTNVIDSLGTTNAVETTLTGVTNTVAAIGAIGGYRTMTLNPTANEEGVSIKLEVTATKRLILSTPSGATASFSVTWGGAGGTNGLGGIDLIAGNPDASQSRLKFNLRSADFASNFTWSFTDTQSQTASYTGNFPVESSSPPELPYDIALASFSGSINWNSINFITFSGGGVPELDLNVSAPFSVETTPVPEPGTWAAAALLAGVAGFIHWRRRRANA
jgi:MYXO-CTERM domain-containing protein